MLRKSPVPLLCSLPTRSSTTGAAAAAAAVSPRMTHRSRTPGTRRRSQRQGERRARGRSRPSLRPTRPARARSAVTKGAAACRAEERAEAAHGTGRTSVIRGDTAAAAARAVAEDAPSDGVGQRTGRTGASGVGAVAAATRRAEAGVEAMVATEAGREVRNILAGRKIGVERVGAEAGGAGIALKAKGRVRGPVEKTETDETSFPGAERSATCLRRTASATMSLSPGLRTGQV